MSIERKKLKAEAKKSIREAKPSPILVTLAIVVITLILQLLGMSLNGEFAAMAAMYQAAMTGEMLYVEPSGATGFGWVLMLAIELMAMVLAVGFTLYCLRISRHIKAGAGDMFDAFGIFFRAIWMSIVPSLLVSAWSMLYALPVSLLVVNTGAVWPLYAGLPLLIPAYRAYYSYRQAVFIMLDNPHLSGMQCIALSKAAMQGHRWELFVLDLSFLGWNLLCVVPFVWLWVLPYTRVTEANYYADVMGDFAVRSGRVPHFGDEQASAREDDDGNSNG